MIAQFLRNSMKDENDEKVKIVDQIIINKFLIRDVNVKNVNENFDFELTKRKVNELFLNM